MKFRPHRGSLADAMSEVVELESRAHLEQHVKSMWGVPADGKITVEKYGTGIDKRIGWDTHIVCVDGSPIGFTDGPCPLSDPAT